jgi:hypothetical protein
MPITVYGASDDMIEVEGDITEEFDYTGDTPNSGDLLAFSDGTVLRIRFDDAGVWRIVKVAGGPVDIAQAPEGDDSNYTDRATIKGADWVVHGIDWAKR